MIKKIIFGIIAAAMILLTIVSAVQSYSYTQIYDDWYPAHPHLTYEQQMRMPTVSGPYPQQFLMHKVYGEPRHDDFNHYDNFVGYKDMDLFRPNGEVDVIRNAQPTRPIWNDVASDGTQLFGHHVYGIIPDGTVYRKHYMHEHPAEGYYGTGYFVPMLAYKKYPVPTSSCRSKSICQKVKGCC